MNAYLLDTSILSVYLDPMHPDHVNRRASVDSLPADSPRYISVITIGELTFGVELASALKKGDLSSLNAMICIARNYGSLEISHHTSKAYGELKSRLAVKYLAKPLRRDRPKYIDDWVDRATGKTLGIDENDLWLCAQSKERNLILVSLDKKIQRIRDADPEVKLLLL